MITERLKERRRKKLILISVVLVIVACSISLTRSACRGRPKRDYSASESIGRVVAEETSRLLNQKGNVVVLANSQGAQKAQLRAFRDELGRWVDMRILSVREFTPEEIGMHAISGQVPWEKMREVLEKFRDANAIVSFLGPPEIPDPDRTGDGSAWPKFIVFAPMGIGVKDLLLHNIVQVAIVPRVGLVAPRSGQSSGLPPEASAPTSRGAHFDSQYLLLTSESDLSSYMEPVVPAMPPAKR